MRIAPLALVCLAFSTSCSSSSSSEPATNDASTDTSPSQDTTPADTATNDGPADGGGGLTCGDPPLIEERGNVVVLAADGSTSPKGDVTIGISLCPGATLVTPPDGSFDIHVSSGKPLYFTYQSADTIPMIRGEYSLIGNSLAVTPTLYPNAFASLFTDFGPTKTVIFTYGRVSGGTGACSTLDGMSLAVTGHPEAVITYYDESLPPKPIAGGTATSKSALVAITGLAPDQTVTVTGSKPGCTVKLDAPPRTGRAPLLAGYLTSMSVTLSN